MILNIPDTCKVDNIIFKKHFYENGSLSVNDKMIFTDITNKIIWKYSIKEENSFIRKFSNDNYEYLEVEVIEIELNYKAREKRIAEIIMRIIPYPMLLILHSENQVKYFVSHQRNSQQDSDKNVLEEIISTDWLDYGSSLKLDFKTLRHTNFYDFYSDIVDRICVFNAQNLTNDDINGEQARLLIKHKEQIELKLASLRAKLKKETQFNRKVELNMEIKRLERENEGLTINKNR